jgi:hypothetical protein
VAADGVVGCPQGPGCESAAVPMNVPHVCDGGRGVRPTGRGMYLVTASLPAS